MEPAKGKILISEPFLLDPNFKRTVILLTEHNEKGSIGFVLNRPTGMELNEASADFPKFKAPLFYGGPVQPDTLHFIHKAGSLIEGSEEIIKGVYWGGNFETLKILAEKKQVKPADFRFFIGYSGWAAAQLEQELKERSWLVTEANTGYLFSKTPVDLWGKILKDIGSKYSVIAQFPESPSMN